MEPRGPIEIRSKEHGVHVTGVNFPERTIELVVMPYEEETLVEYQGRMVTEICSRGAYDGIQRRAKDIKVNRDHDVTRTCGKTLVLHPRREEGLVAEIWMSKTELGTDTLTMADEGILDASAGFLPFPGGEKWETRSRRRITKAWLGHIALTPDPAYESARVLAVRQKPNGEVSLVSEERPSTPNLDIVHGWRLQEEYDRLNRYIPTS
jgi:Phage head maturation protease